MLHRQSIKFSVFFCDPNPYWRMLASFIFGLFTIFIDNFDDHTYMILTEILYCLAIYFAPFSKSDDSFKLQQICFLSRNTGSCWRVLACGVWRKFPYFMSCCWLGGEAAPATPSRNVHFRHAPAASSQLLLPIHSLPFTPPSLATLPTLYIPIGNRSTLRTPYIEHE